MSRNIAAYLDGAVPFGDTLYVEPLMEQAMRGLVRDIGREVPDLRFRAVQRCVTDDHRPLDRMELIVPIVFMSLQAMNAVTIRLFQRSVHLGLLGYLITALPASEWLWDIPGSRPLCLSPDPWAIS